VIRNCICSLGNTWSPVLLSSVYPATTVASAAFARVRRTDKLGNEQLCETQMQLLNFHCTLLNSKHVALKNHSASIEIQTDNYFSLNGMFPAKPDATQAVGQ